MIGALQNGVKLLVPDYELIITREFREDYCIARRLPHTSESAARLVIEESRARNVEPFDMNEWASRSCALFDLVPPELIQPLLSRRDRNRVIGQRLERGVDDGRSTLAGAARGGNKQRRQEPSAHSDQGTSAGPSGTIP